MEGRSLASCSDSGQGLVETALLLPLLFLLTSASASNAPRYQIWGTVFDASPSSSMTLTGVQLGPHNVNPSSSDSSGQYAINGEFIGAFLSINNGNVLGNAAGTPATCPGGSIGPGTPALLAQFNQKFAPAPGVNSYLVQ